MMRALVTGANGCLGRSLVPLLLSSGWEVVILGRPGSDLTFFDESDVRMIVGDVLEPDSFNKELVGFFDGIFHLAGNGSLWDQNNEFQNQIHIEGTDNLLTFAAERGCRRFIYVSSYLAWGLQNQILMETLEKKGFESSINYCRSKHLAEYKVISATEDGLESVILNPAQIVGPYDEQNFGQFYRRLAKHQIPIIPNGLMTLCHPDAIAQACLSAWSQGAIGQSYLLGGPTITYHELAEKICKTLAIETPRRAPSLMFHAMGTVNSLLAKISKREPFLTKERARLVTSDIKIDDSLAQNELGYQPTAMSKILEDFFDWMESLRRDGL
ncbi:MAG: NAD-dependent epimerase/dehydratase family protein [Pseudobacteriovorax sp.]|nr:NAD-dependent epimerase/dehydratase family protein [Pseudobacteriovorax sp.]